jgi:hypothetical protein
MSGEGPPPEDVFRPEALEYHARHRGPGEVLRASPAWSTWAYRILLVLVVIGFVAAWVVRIDGDRLLLVLVGRD